MNKIFALWFSLALAALMAALPVQAKVTSEEAARLKNELTPFGAEKAGNKDGSIPAWTGGFSEKPRETGPDGRIGDPFAKEKPLLAINSKNMDQYAESLTEGTMALLKKYPDSFRLDVYPTHRTASAPQWVYDNTFQNATRATLENNVPRGAYGGIPFPIPQSGAEVMWNHALRWRGTQFEHLNTWYQLLSDGRPVQVTDGVTKEQLPYYFKEGSLAQYEKETKPFWQILIRNIGPPIRAGEALLAHEYLDQSTTQTWVYLKGQRRVRKLPNACCDTPTPAAAGVMTFDEIYTWTGRLDRFDWKIAGKKEMFIPYNTNGFLQPKTDQEILAGGHYNPDHMRWEKHRVWVVDATVREGERHQTPKNRYYCDEDTWICTLGDRWDAKGQLWRTLWNQTYIVPNLPGVVAGAFGYHDLLSGAGFIAHLFNSKSKHYVLKEGISETDFTPDAMVGGSVR